MCWVPLTQRLGRLVFTELGRGQAGREMGARVALALVQVALGRPLALGETKFCVLVWPGFGCARGLRLAFLGLRLASHCRSSHV